MDIGRASGERSPADVRNGRMVRAAAEMGAPGIEVGERLIDSTRLRSTFRGYCRVYWWMPRGVRSHSPQPVFTLPLDDLTGVTGCTMRSLRIARRLWAAREGLAEFPRLTLRDWLMAAAMLAEQRIE